MHADVTAHLQNDNTTGYVVIKKTTSLINNLFSYFLYLAI